MKSLIPPLLAFSILIFAQHAFAQSKPDCNNLVGVWSNQLHSILTITSVNPATGELRGTYQSPSGTAGQKFPLIGWINKTSPAPGKDFATAVVFSVRWGKYGTITSWTGYCGTDSSGQTKITTIWNLVNAKADYTWSHILTNSDVFTPVP